MNVDDRRIMHSWRSCLLENNVLKGQERPYLGISQQCDRERYSLDTVCQNTVHTKLCGYPPLTNAAIVIKCLIIKLFVQSLTLFHNLNYVWLHQVFFSFCLVFHFYGLFFYNFSFYRKYNKSNQIW